MAQHLHTTEEDEHSSHALKHIGIIGRIPYASAGGQAEKAQSIISPGDEAMLKVYGVWMMVRDFVLWCRPHQQPSTLCTLVHRCLSRGSFGPHAHGHRTIYAWGSTFD